MNNKFIAFREKDIVYLEIHYERNTSFIISFLGSMNTFVKFLDPFVLIQTAFAEEDNAAL